MTPAIDAVCDHVAVAVPPGDRAERRWREELGGGPVSAEDSGVFVARQFRFAGGGKLELLSPSPTDFSPHNFVRRFLERFGTAVHHVTLKVPSLAPALERLEAAGLDVVDVAQHGDVWHEGFLRPKQVGGLVVQVAWSSGSDEDWARRSGFASRPPAPGAPVLLGPRLRHPDLQAARRVWSVLGAEVASADGGLVCRWPRSPLEVVVEEGSPAGPVALRLRGTPSRPAEPGVSPQVDGDG